MMASAKQKKWRKARKKWNSLNYQFEQQTGQSLKVLFNDNEKKGIRAVEQGLLSEIDNIEKLLSRAWFRHNQQKQNHMNAHSNFYECSQLRLKSWEVDGIGHSNFNGPRYQNPRTTKELTKRLNIEYK
jgi:hypothetical protein